MNRSLHLGMRMICLTLCLVCLLSVIRPAAAEVTTTEEQTVAQTMTTVVYLRASTGAAPIGQMEDGTAVTVLDELRDYYKVDCYDTVGYIAKSQIVHRDDKYYVNCNAESEHTRRMTYTDHAEVLALRHSLTALARKQLGSRYVLGGSRPGTFDCSGLTYYLYGKHSIGLHRTASQQLQDGIVVSREGVQVGDLIFFREPGTITAASHVGIYIGNNKIIHSASAGVIVTDLDEGYYLRNYLCARRIVNVAATQLEQPVAVSRSIGILSTNGVSGRTVN